MPRSRRLALARRNRARPALRCARAPEKPHVHGNGRCHAGTVHRGEHRHLQRGGRGFVAAPAVPASGAAVLGRQAFPRQGLRRLPYERLGRGLGGGARQRHLCGRSRVQRWFDGGQLCGGRRRRVREAAARLGRILSGAGHGAARRAGVLGGGRPPGRSGGDGAELRAVEARISRRPLDCGTGGHLAGRAAHDRRRAAGAVPEHCSSGLVDAATRVPIGRGRRLQLCRRGPLAFPRDVGAG